MMYGHISPRIICLNADRVDESGGLGANLPVDTPPPPWLGSDARVGTLMPGVIFNESLLNLPAEINLESCAGIASQ